MNFKISFGWKQLIVEQQLNMFDIYIRLPSK